MSWAQLGKNQRAMLVAIGSPVKGISLASRLSATCSSEAIVRAWGTLEARGLIVLSDGQGWALTDAGRELLRMEVPGA